MKYQNIKNIFLDFFREKKHKIIPSFPILLENDSKNFFVNAGMNPFKEYFLGYKVSKYLRIANVQRCLRVSGKHNDFEQVGYDNYHHTMFEMMGNWSFGDYSRNKIIEWAWELLINKYNIPKNDIYVTIFLGDKKDKTCLDKETFKYWNFFVKKDHILFFGKEHNFWEMGDYGPCGPSTEIHVDLRSHKEKNNISGRNLINTNHPEVIEIWNIVFIEFLRKKDHTLNSLKIKHVDTGMGLERLCMVLQEKKSSYDTDIFYPIISNIKEYLNLKKIDKYQKIAIQIIADHLRSVIFTINDGQLPSNNKSGYIVRKIIRRFIIHANIFLKKKNPFVYQLIPFFIKKMEKYYPELKNQENYISEIIKKEEISFFYVIKKGNKKIYNIIDQYQNKKNKIVDGSLIFQLYDTYGYPINMAKILLKKNNLSINNNELSEKLSKQIERSKKNHETIIKNDWICLNHEKKIEENQFIGYKCLSCDTFIIKYRKIIYKSNKKNYYYELVLSQTPFYPEGGGQIGDIGYLKNNFEKINIYNTIKEESLILHFSKRIPNNIYSVFRSYVDEKNRKKISINHTSTHLLNLSLKKIIGENIQQKGSYIGSDYLRFDFSHDEKINYNDLIKIEDFVQNLIYSKITLNEKIFSSIEEIKIDYPNFYKKKINNYKGEKLRLISFGDSHEFCIGTHVKNTQSIKTFKILSESSVSYGIRRIKAVTHDIAIKKLKDTYNKYFFYKKNINHDKIFFHLKNENKNLKKINSNIHIDLINFLKKEYLKKVKIINNIQYINHFFYKNYLYSLDNLMIKKIGIDLIQKIENLFIFTGFLKDKKCFMFIFISKKIQENKKINALNIMNNILGKKYKIKSWGKKNFSSSIVDNVNDNDYNLFFNDIKEYLK